MAALPNLFSAQGKPTPVAHAYAAAALGVAPKRLPTLFGPQGRPTAAAHAGATGAFNATGTPYAAPPAVPAAPPAVPPAPSSAGSDPNVLDSTALANIASNQFKTNQQVDALNSQEANAGTALQSTLGQLAYQQPRDQLKLLQGYNWGGHDIYSTAYDQAQGDLAHTYLGKQTAAQQKYSDLASSIASKISGLQGAEGLYGDQEAAASAARQAKIDASAPAAPLAPPAPPAPPSAPAAPRAAPKAPTSNRLLFHPPGRGMDRPAAKPKGRR